MLDVDRGCAAAEARAGLALRSTTGAGLAGAGALADGVAADCGGAAAAGAGAWLLARVVVTWLTVRAGAGFAAATWVVRLTALLATDVGDGAVSVAGNVLVSRVAGAVVSGTGVGAGVGVAVGWESVVTGCACWAAKGVDESARAAAIAGRALARA
jgi:hypothetical protein